jgi:DedD protein
LDTALKHRLTGAVILVLLAVLLLPELLTGSGEAAKSSSAAQNGAVDGERRFEVDLTESASAPASALPQPQSQPQPQPAVEAPLELPVTSTVSPPPAAASLPAPVVATAPEKAAVTPAPKAELKTEPKAEPKAEPKIVAKVEPTPEAKPAGSYYVQIGVFVNAASARRLERQLRDKKFAVVVDEITRSGKTMFRVRVGPESDRAAANALAKKLADAGHKGSVVQ